MDILDYKDYLTKNYINIIYQILNQNLKSTTKEYVNKLIKKIKKSKF